MKRRFFGYAAGAALFLLFLFSSADARQGAADGLRLWGTLLVPSLLPVLCRRGTSHAARCGGRARAASRPGRRAALRRERRGRGSVPARSLRADTRSGRQASERFIGMVRSERTKPSICSPSAIIPARRSPWARLAWECSAPPGGGCCSGASTPSPPPLSAFSSAGGRAAAKLRSNRRGGRRTLARRSAARSPPQGRQYCRSAHM